MRKCKLYFSRKDSLFTIACIAFLLANLGIIGSTGRRKAKETVCLSNLRQWGAIFQAFTNDNDGYFCDAGSLGWKSGAWILALRPRMETRTNLLRCPEATRRHPTKVNYGGPFNTYVVGSGGLQDRREEGSYGANLWIYNPRSWETHIQNRPTKWNWKTPHVKGANNIPILADSMWRGGGPFDGELGPDQIPSRGAPPEYNGQWAGTNMEMYHFCINRHNGAVGCVFMDWSARKVGLKELWTLKWHREFNTAGPWTLAGGVLPRNWPEWMKNFKDY
ncbi:MAG: hypothetical protein KAY65_11280 [Planctomycetes bacterium]|nr:hypothetical protein [Planctomycetota bacterium]